MPKTEEKWNPQIQMVRGVAIVFVVAFHFMNGPEFWGIFGVNLFFCTSGYLITGILIRDKEENGKINLKEFALKRIRRLLPAASVLIILVVLLNFAGLLNGYKRDYLISGTAYLIYMGNIVGLLPHGHHTTALAFGHLWTLSTEMQFYFLWSLLFINVLLLLSRKYQVLVTTFLIIVGIPFLQFAFRPLTETVVTNTIDCLGSFLIGTLLYLLFKKQIVLRNRILHFAVMLFGSASLLSMMLQYFVRVTIPRGIFSSLLSVSVVCTFLLVLGLDDSPWQKPLRHIGDVSYSLYLIHYPVYLVFWTYSHSIWSGIISLCISLCLAEFSFTFIERRFWHPSIGKRAASGN